MPKNSYTTLYLLFLSSLGYLVTDIYLPSLPAIARYFHASDSQVQMTLFSYLLSFSFTPLFFGPLSDHIGRKKTLLLGVILALISTCGCLFAGHIEEFIAWRFFQGIGCGAILIASRATVSDLFTGKALAKQMSLLTMMMPFILAVSPIVGGLLQESLGWRAVFLFLVCYMALLVFLVLSFPETLKQESQEKIRDIFLRYRHPLKNGRFLLLTFNFSLPSFGLFGYLSVSPFLFQQVIGLSPAAYGFLALYVGVTIVLTGYLNFKGLHYFSAYRMMLLGSFLMMLSGTILLVFHLLHILTTNSLLLPALLFFTSIPFCVSNAASLAMGSIRTHFGSASALLTTLQFLVGSLASFVFSFFSKETLLPLALCFMILGFLSWLNASYVALLDERLSLVDEEGRKETQT